jgi:hypothetical protein
MALFFQLISLLILGINLWWFSPLRQNGRQSTTNFIYLNLVCVLLCTWQDLDYSAAQRHIKPLNASFWCYFALNSALILIRAEQNHNP